LFLTERDCDPNVCPFAKGYFDKIQGAMSEALETTNHFTKDVIESLARAHEVCPFELSLDLSSVADVVVCDYNYVFDPKARLTRYFEVNRPVRLLIDEAHNLVSRTKSMYSALLQASELRPLLETTIPAPLKRSIKTVITALEQPSYDSPLLDQDIVRSVSKAFDSLSDYLLQQAAHPDRKVLLKGMFHLLDFRRILYNMNTAYHVIHDGQNQHLKLACLNAKDYIIPLLQELKGTVLFSATLDPLQYYQAYLTGSLGKVLRVDSPFSSDQVMTGLIDHVSVRYNKREQTLTTVMEYLTQLTSTSKNTICFAPSYQYIQLMLPRLPKGAIVQTKDLSLQERDAILERFQTEQGLLGVFVVGGVFAEGVDYLGAMVEQLLIIGVGMPGVDIETNKTKEYFDQLGLNGFDYAYRYPGFAKIIQAAGRLIRSFSDHGIVLLLDERYKEPVYQQMIPSFYGTLLPIRSVDQCTALIDQFWTTKKHV
jgi:Rad3-related DNA helicases